MPGARASMKALVLRGRTAALEEIAAPRCKQPDDVVVGVAVAGVCRTDCYLATGQMAATTPAATPLVLGHELAGVVREAGPASGFEPGERVACMPLLGCGQCAPCRAGRAHVCPHGQMLGLDRDGGFAERVRVPASALGRVPAGLSLRHAAFAEPVAAALAVPEALTDAWTDASTEASADAARANQGLILGQGRIATLTARVLAARGFGQVQIRPVPERVDASDADAFDFVVETSATERSFAAALALLKPRGTLVLKSRPPWLVALDVVGCVRKELRLVGAYYGSLAAALDLMHTRAIEVDDLLGPGHALADHQAVFAAELAGDEARKQFFVMGD
ncbi:MAG TPA: alcohol dehydrogenase catalytic domain-containing protein [Haliangium sp.]|nr:alcohol dehydrogenase catalytic domain-containing protein [Haliangium sp.]